ncbi:MAG: DUF2165 family protein [Paracoccaceae bacterium]
MDVLLLLVDAVLVAGLGVWMVVAVADNWRHPKMNENAVAMVVRMDALCDEFPDDYAQVAYRRIENPRIIRLLFHTMRLAETIAAVTLITASALLIGAALGAVSATVATGLAIASSAFFVSIWAGFIIGGNYFAYWYCHQWAQSNHFMFMIWGFLVLIVLLR